MRKYYYNSRLDRDTYRTNLLKHIDFLLKDQPNSMEKYKKEVDNILYFVCRVLENGELRLIIGRSTLNEATKKLVCLSESNPENGYLLLKKELRYKPAVKGEIVKLYSY